MEDGAIGLIDFGQVKQISGRERLTLAKVMVALAERESDDNPEDLATISRLGLGLGLGLGSRSRSRLELGSGSG